MTGLDELLARFKMLEATLAERDRQLAERDRQLAERDRQLAERDRQLAERDRQLAERDARIALLEKRVAELEERLNRNSGNSSKPPSTDSPSQREQRRQRSASRGKDSGKKQGAQAGHKGHKRRLVPPEEVTTVVVCAPESCGSCGLELDASHDIAVHREQVVELPPVTPIVTEYRLHRRQCAGCGKEHVGQRPPGAAPGGFGPRLTAIAGTLTGAFHLSRRSAVVLLRDLFGVGMSTGALSSCERRVAEALATSHEEARAHVENAPSRYIDATTWYTKASRSAVWVVATAMVTLIAMTANASRAALLTIVGRITGRIVGDRATVFNCWQGTQRQTCWAHLLRYFEGMAQRDGPASQVGTALCNLTLAMFSIWHDFKRGTITRVELQAHFRTPRGQPKPEVFVERVRAVLDYGRVCGDRSTEGTCRDILEKHWDSLWVFLDIDGVDPTNNHAERELRSTVKWRQTSFGTQSKRGNLFAERIMTASRTLRKQVRPLYPFVRDTLVAHWSGATKPSILPQPIEPSQSVAEAA